jgi:DNA-binding NarL/FixJ family response regulator
MRVVIAEDHALLRDGLTRLLTAHGIDVVAAVDDGPGLVQAITTTSPDLAVSDVRLPPTFRDEGLRAALEARRRRPSTAVLVLSQYVERAYATELLSATASGGDLLKDRIGHVRDFRQAVHDVASGGTTIDPQVVSQLLLRRATSSPIDELTPRELDVTALMAQGRTNAAIATALVITEGAVEKHVQSIFRKLDLPRTADDHRRVLAVLTYLGGPAEPDA